MATLQTRFPYLWEVEPPTGADSWQRMYPYFLVSREETRAQEQPLFWFQDKMHHAHPYYPFDTITFEAWGLSCGQNSARIFALPPALGIDQRLVNGYLYLAPIGVQDPQEIGRRVEAFQQRAGYYYEHWNDLFEAWRKKTEAVIHDMEAVTFPPLPDLEPLEVVTEGRGRSTGYDVLTAYNALIDHFFLIWQYHFEMLNIGYAAYITFFEFLKGAFPDIEDQSIARMVAGIDVLTFRPDDELKKLARRAVELGVQDVFSRGLAPQAVLRELDASEAGKQWLSALDEAKYPWFNFSSEYGFYHDQPAWINDLSIPFSGIGGYIERLRRGEDIARPVERLRAEREQIAAEYRALLPSDEARQQFDQLLGLSRTVFPFIEDHNFYVEHWSHTVFWDKMRELGRLLTEQGVLEEREDVFFLTRHEVAETLADAVHAWAIGVPARGAQRCRSEVAGRKRILAALREWTAPPALGEAPEVVTDPFAIMNYGITSARVREWLGGRDGQAAELAGIAASPGVAEGPARVIRSDKELGQVQPGEILVCPITAPSWAPVFSLIRGAVTDIGGMMCHAAIVCREYGLPTVTGTGFATTTIRTGQRIRVDGNRGAVSILD
jgi:pyruvate, water dikinase